MALNTAPGGAPDVSGGYTSLGHNLVGVTNGSIGFGAAGDLLGWNTQALDPSLGPLADNGGPTWTHALLNSSPAVDAGDSAHAPTTDQRGFPRVVGTAADIGAYEYTGGATTSGLPWAWLIQYGLPTDGSADNTDSDLDGHTTWQEWRCRTSPTNALSALRLLSAAPSGNHVTLTWASVAGVNYFLERSTNVAGPPPHFTPLATAIPGQPGTTTFTDTNAATSSAHFYRVGVMP
jgi:hypothetical protein